MLTLKLNKDKVISENGDIILTDMTGNVGDTYYEQSEEDATQYVLVTNTTGYGTPNADRSSLSLNISGVKVGLKSDTVVSFDGYNPATVSTWVAQIDGDGLYKFKIVEGDTEVADSAEVEFLYLIEAGKLYSKLVAKRVDLMMRECPEREVTMCTKAIDDVEAGIYAAEYEYSKGNKLNAVRVMDYLNNKDYSAVLAL